MRFFNILFALLFSAAGFGQSVNDYQYVIVPQQYEFLKSADRYELNSLTKFLFNKYGFAAYLEGDDKPFTIKDSGCDVLYADVEDNSNILRTRLIVLLKDCDDNVIFTSSRGQSKNKDYQKAYHQALRGAFEDIAALEYHYTGAPKQESVTSATAITTNMSQPLEPTQDVTNEVNESKELIVVNPPNATATLNTDQPSTTSNNKPEVSATPVLYTTADGSYKAVQFGDSINFFEGDKSIGIANISATKTFTINTSQFNGNATLAGDQLVVDRKVKGVAGTVQMIFTRQ